jgi:hypothetical protein
MDPDHEIGAYNTVILLERLERKSGARCRGLADEELLWEPVEDSWNLMPDAAAPWWSVLSLRLRPTTDP